MPETTILIVHNDESTRKDIGCTLEEAGYTVRSESTGEGGIESIQVDRPDLIVADLQTSDMDGITLLAKIKEIDNTIPVIVLAALGYVETAVHAMKLGASGYLTKPINSDELTIIVEKAIRIRRLFEENEALKETVRKQLEVMKAEQTPIEAARPTTLPEIERRAVIEALIESNGNKSKAARRLGIPRHVLLYRIKKFNIHRNWPDHD